LPSIVNALNQQRIIEDCRRNKSKLSAQEHEGLYNKLNNSGFLAPIDSNKTQTNIYNITANYWHATRNFTYYSHATQLYTIYSHATPLLALTLCT
jgi:hypothetical protein